MKTPPIFLLLLLALLSIQSSAQTSYKLDSSFGDKGIFYDYLPDMSATAFTTAMQPDGKVLVGGAYFDANGSVFADSAFLWRLNANGTPDYSFKPTNGILKTPEAKKYVRQIAVAADGKILFTTSRSGVQLVRLNSDGGVDSTLNGGLPLTVLSNAGTRAQAMLLQSDGKIIIGAQVLGSAPQVYVYRLNKDGSPDLSFGISGRFTTTSYRDTLVNFANLGFILDTKDRLYMPVLKSPAQPSAHQVLRLDAGGQPDATYGTAGFSDAISQKDSFLTFGITQLANGQIVGYNITNGSLPDLDINTFRWDTAGHADAAYGTGGIRSMSHSGFDYSFSRIRSFANGNRLVVLFDLPSNVAAGYRDIVMLGMNERGNLDSSFAGGGELRVHQQIPGGATMWGATRAADGTILANTWMYESHGTVMKFKPTPYPAGISTVNGKLPLNISPNPATSFLTLAVKRGCAYTLFDGSGKAVLRGKTAAYKTTIDLQALPAGAYFLYCADGGANAALTVLKQ